MNDVVAVALISGGLSLLGGGVGAWTTYKVNLRNTDATIATAESQHKTELARIEAENRRLERSNLEEERRNRQSTYHQYLDAVIEIFQTMGATPSVEEVTKNRDHYRYLHAGVVLFGDPTVREGAYKVGKVYSEVSPALDKHREEHPTQSEAEHWRDATADLRESFGQEIGKLTELMHADVTRRIAEVEND